jgi:hypothetical protein
MQFYLRHIIWLSIFIAGCKNNPIPDPLSLADPELLHTSVKALTDVVVHDIFSPPVAARIYAYSTIAAYEIARLERPEMVSLSGQIRHMHQLPGPDPKKEICIPMAATLALLKTGKALIFSEDSIDVKIRDVRKYFKGAGLSSKVLEYSEIYADSISKYILDWAKADNYAQTRSFPKYSLQKDPATWKPTPPGYMDAIEPSWNKIRTFVMDSAQQFKPEPPPPFDISDKNSAFYKDVVDVYNTVKNATADQMAIADFWDCNPYKLNVTGHVMHATKKITPGGHWINITGVVCSQTSKNIRESAAVYAMVSLALADGFISCWDEKYRSLMVRPETVINEYIDPDWVPALQTPPFPEYTSGHSVISSAAAVVLTDIFGSNFQFEDDTENEFGLPTRSFRSFEHAAEEASISRLYGGIHYRPAIENGIKQGKAIGNFILGRINI